MLSVRRLGYHSVQIGLRKGVLDLEKGALEMEERLIHYKVLNYPIQRGVLTKLVVLKVFKVTSGPTTE